MRAVLFDAGNTLIYAHPGRLAEILRASGADTDSEQVTGAELQARRVLHEAIVQGYAGTEPEVWREYFAAIFRFAGVPEAGMAEAARRLREVHAADHLWTHVEAGTGEALDALAGAGYRLAVISNADGRVEAVLETVRLRAHFEFVVDSAVVGIEKPDPAIFLEGCRRLGLPARECLYVGDLYPVDYVGATAAGLSAVLLDPLGLHDGKAPRIGTLGELPGFLSRRAD